MNEHFFNKSANHAAHRNKNNIWLLKKKWWIIKDDDANGLNEAYLTPQKQTISDEILQKH